MIRVSRMTFTEHGDPRVTITVEGWSDVYRLADGLTTLQVEFGAIGRKMLRATKKRLGSARYKAYQEHLHGRVKHG